MSALESAGMSWERLERLARKALSDEKARRHITLDEYRDQRAHEHLFDVGLEWASRYRAELANGVSFPTSCYRRMCRRLPDYLRAEHGDERRGTPLHQAPTLTGLMPDRELVDAETFDQAVESVSANLPSRPLWTLHHLARPIAEDNLTLAQAAVRAGIDESFAADLLEELGWHLGRRHVETVDEGGAVFEMILDWAGAA